MFIKNVKYFFPSGEEIYFNFEERNIFQLPKERSISTEKIFQNVQFRNAYSIKSLTVL